MTGHRLTVTAVCVSSPLIEATCSCGTLVLDGEFAISLDRLAELMHEHIVAAESSRQVDPVVNPRSVLPPEFYGDEPSPVEHTGPVVYPITDGNGRIIGHSY